MSFNKKTKIFLFAILAFVICGVIVFYKMPSYGNIKYSSEAILGNNTLDNKTNKNTIEVIDGENKTKGITDNQKPVVHINTPENVKALYVSSWVAGTTKFRDSVIKIIDETELNAIVIDIKDSTGRVSFTIDDPTIKNTGSIENRISNIRALTDLLHEKNIYIIGRISVFQDPYMTNKKPEWAITKISDGKVWKDHKGLSFLDPARKEVREYIVSIATNSYALGFDEINFDYIRYPSDGNMQDINYRLKEGKTRADNIEEFFKYLSKELKENADIPISGDLFGLTTEAKDDMGIGQVWEKALPYFDFLCPMVYPSHYPPGHMGYKNPASFPYEVINQALKGAIAKTSAMGENINKIRPWLQDFDLGATYTKELIRAQMKAGYDNNINSWMLWDPSNKYTPSALKIE